MPRRTGHQKRVAGLKEPSGHDKKEKRKQQDVEDQKLSERMSKFIKIEHLKMSTVNLEISSNNDSPPATENGTLPPASEINDNNPKGPKSVDQLNPDAGPADDLPIASESVTSLYEARCVGANSPVPGNGNHCDLTDAEEGAKSTGIDKTSNETVNFQDPSTWPLPLPDMLRMQLLEDGPIQVIREEYPKVNGRGFGRDHFVRQSTTQEKTHRDWFIYSTTTNSVYCFPCSMFSSKPSSSPFSNYGVNCQGFNDFVHQSRAYSLHEESQQHFVAVIAWREYQRMRKSQSSLVNMATAEYRQEASFWRDVLRSIIDAVLFLAKNNLAFRGTSERIGEYGSGNFLSLLELLSHYYPPLALHIQRLEHGKTSYMSPYIQNEFISLAARTVRNNVIQDIQKRKFYSIMIDATPDTSHQEQFSLIIRSVDVTTQGCSIEENFLGFINFDKKTGADICKMIITELKKDGFELKNCRGQGYDNAANMSGIRNGVQAYFLAESPTADYVPCAAHSLNLVGQNAVSKVIHGKLLLGQVQNLFNFFSASTSRWTVLSEHSKHTLKCQSSTRWSSMADAIHVLNTEFPNILSALDALINSDATNAPTLVDASALYTQICTFKFLLGIGIWGEILSKIDIVNKKLQRKKMDVEQAVKHLNGLLMFLQEFSKTGFSTCLTEAKEKAKMLNISEASGFDYRISRNRLPARFRNETEAEQQPESNLAKFQSEFFDAITKKLVKEFEERFKSLRTHSEMFHFLWGKSLAGNSSIECNKSAMDLAIKYKDDLEGAKFLKEVQYLKCAVKPFLDEGLSLEDTGAMDILNILTCNDLADQFPNCHTALRIFLTLPVSVAINERSFSKLKLIKNYMRSRMGQERLSDLAILSIEHEYASKVTYENVIDSFVKEKCRRVNI